MSTYSLPLLYLAALRVKPLREHTAAAQTEDHSIALGGRKVGAKWA